MKSLLLALLLATSSPAQAGLGSLVKLAAKAGKVASKGAKVGKGAGAAAKAVKAGKVVKLGGAMGGMAVAERAAVGLAGMPDDLGRAAAFVAREGEGLAVVRSSGPAAVVDDLAGLSDEALLLDPTVAVEPRLLDAVEGQRVFVMDADGAAHAVRREADGDWVVDVIEEGVGVAVDVGDFAADQLDLEGEAGLADDEPPLWFFFAVGGVVVLLGVREWRKTSTRVAAQE